ncbi:BrkA autotransporter precursor [Budvicia aquatica]|uniref:BrkA autotransporter n=1 Tax=Budvicia aquatica TaxID=82979 RepID=A0A484ZGI2_9GAMM|nr:BrkA autotransporter precursor [Budvicia aquatica]
MTYNGTQLGADKQWQSASGMMYLGAALGQSNSNQDYQNGDGDMRNRHVGLYAGYLDNSGLYVDTLLKYNRMRNEINVKDTPVMGSMAVLSSNGISLSVEAGKRFHFTPEKQRFYIEPQSQLTVAWQDSSHFNNSNGLKVDLSSYTSTLGRVGGLIGYEVTEALPRLMFTLRAAMFMSLTGMLIIV